MGYLLPLALIGSIGGAAYFSGKALNSAVKFVVIGGIVYVIYKKVKK